jgi:hypothetical protein
MDAGRTDRQEWRRCSRGQVHKGWPHRWWPLSYVAQH